MRLSTRNNKSPERRPVWAGVDLKALLKNLRLDVCTLKSKGYGERGKDISHWDSALYKNKFAPS